MDIHCNSNSHSFLYLFNPSIKKQFGKIEMPAIQFDFIIGIGLFLLAVFPYIIVDKLPAFQGYDLATNFYFQLAFPSFFIPLSKKSLKKDTMDSFFLLSFLPFCLLM